MATTDVRAFVEGRLDMEYVEGCARAVAYALLQRNPVEVAYQPGDGTFYGLVFVPLLGLAAAPGRVVTRDGETRTWEHHAARGLYYRPGACLVVSVEQPGVLPCDLATRAAIHWTDVTAAFDVPEASGHAVAILLERVADRLQAQIQREEA